METFFFVEYLTREPTLEGFQEAAEDLVEAYNDLLEFCDNPFDLSLEEITVLSASVLSRRRLLGGEGDYGAEEMAEEQHEVIHVSRKQLSQHDQQQHRREQRRNRIGGNLQGFGPCVEDVHLIKGCLMIPTVVIYNLI